MNCRIQAARRSSPISPFATPSSVATASISLATRAQDPDVLALDLHMTYWNDASWTDPYSLRGADELQREYAALRRDSTVYTPEAVVDGQEFFVGSDAMVTAIEQAKARAVADGAVPIIVSSAAHDVSIDVGSGRGSGVV